MRNLVADSVAEFRSNWGFTKSRRVHDESNFQDGPRDPEPLRGMIEVLEHSHLQRRVLCRVGMNLYVTGCSVAGNVKRRPDRRASDIKATAMKRDAVDKPFIQIERVQFRRIGKAIERLVSAIFFLAQEILPAR